LRGGVHQEPFFKRASALKDGDDRRGNDIGLIFGPFLFGQRAFIALLRKAFRISNVGPDPNPAI
jgi:hypothetical protein